MYYSVIVQLVCSDGLEAVTYKKRREENYCQSAKKSNFILVTTSKNQVIYHIENMCLVHSRSI